MWEIFRADVEFENIFKIELSCNGTSSIGKIVRPLHPKLSINEEDVLVSLNRGVKNFRAACVKEVFCGGLLGIHTRVEIQHEQCTVLGLRVVDEVFEVANSLVRTPLISIARILADYAKCTASPL